MLLEYYGYDVTMASDGVEGLSCVTDAEPDLVVTDWRMPGLSGDALCLAIRRRRARLPIVVVTSAEEVFEHEHPVNAALRKPLDPSRLQAVISAELAIAGLKR